MDCPNFPQMPLEIRQQILFQLPTKSDLCAVATVSKELQLETETMIYRDIYLSSEQKKISAIISFFKMIKDNPGRASLVNAVHIQWYSVNSRYRKYISEAFRVMINLKELIILSNAPHSSRDHNSMVQPSMLHGCPFRLHRYHNFLQTSSTSDTDIFLSEQLELREWIGNTQTLQSIPDTCLPLLVTAQVQLSHHSVLHQLSLRHLRRLSIMLWAEESCGRYADAARTINLLRNSLTHLDLSFTMRDPDEPTGNLVKHLDLPLLQMLRWSSYKVSG